MNKIELNKFVELGLRCYLIPLSSKTKKPINKKFYANGKTEWHWKKDPITNQYIEYSDKELLEATRIGINHEAAGVAQAEEKDEFTIMLTSAGDKKINVIKEVRAFTTLGLKEAKDLVEAAPKEVKSGVNKKEAEEIKAKLEAAGAKVELK